MLRHCSVGLVLVMAGGCSGTAEPTDEAVTEPTDDPTTTEPTDEDDTDTKTTATTGDTGTAPPTDITLDIDGDWSDMGLTVIPISQPLAIFYYWSFGEALTSEVVTSATPVLALDTPVDTLSPVPQFDGVRWSAHVVGLFDDDGDGIRQPSEVWTAFSTHMLVYVEADAGLPASLATAGIVEGWNAVNLGEGGFGDVAPLAAVPVPIHALADTITMSGTAVVTKGANERLTLQPNDALYYNTAVKTVLYDEPLADTWTISLTGGPPADHRSYGKKSVPDGFAVEQPVVYIDTDEDGAFDSYTDKVVGAVCADKQRLIPVWLEHTPDLRFALQFEGRTGWHGLTLDYKTYRVQFQTGEITGLVASSTCY